MRARSRTSSARTCVVTAIQLSHACGAPGWDLGSMSACLRAQSTGGLGKAGGGADAAPRKRLSPGRMQGFREGADEASRRRSGWRLFPARGREERGGFFVHKTSPSPRSPTPESLLQINSSVWGRSGFSLLIRHLPAEPHQLTGRGRVLPPPSFPGATHRERTQPSQH